jgi:hypothetical protein
MKSAGKERRVIAIPLARPSPRRVLTAGLAASTAYLVEMVIDRRSIGRDYDDVTLWGDLLTDSPRLQLPLGLAVHFSIGTALAATYQALLPALPRLPGPVLGLIFCQIESAVTFPSVLWADAHHPAVASGKLGRLWSRDYFLAEAARHAAYGVVLGLLSERRS